MLIVTAGNRDDRWLAELQNHSLCFLMLP